MTRLQWQVTKKVRVGRFDVPCADELNVAESPVAPRKEKKATHSCYVFGVRK
ncbi:MAG: hypothetical protein L0Y44_04195 [Phycisphaerales bacterium]|nr:hypothetical protein [Phycisphaerales bacterium]MCI0629839.1 hypothetical protein [Phycisphaerales bacterium]